MEQTQKLYEEGSVWKAIGSMCVPVVVSMLVVVAYNIVDLFFIGMTHDSYQVAAVSLAGPVFMILMACGSLFGGGACVAIARALGEKKADKVKAYSSLCTWSCVLTGAAVSAMILIKPDFFVRLVGADETTDLFTKEYIMVLGIGAIPTIFSSAYANLIRSEGAVKEAVLSNLLATAVNLVFDPILILALGLGVKGAAIATVMGNMAGCVYLLVYTRRKSGLSVSRKDLHLSVREGAYMFFLGQPNAAGNITSGLTQTVQNQLLIGYGALSVAAMGVSGKATLVVCMVAMGIGMGVQPMMAYHMGAGNRERTREVVKDGIILSTLLAAVLAALCFIFRRPLIAAFVTDEATIQIAVGILSIQVLGAPFYGIYYMSINYLQAGGRAFAATLISVLRGGLVLIPVTLLFHGLMGESGIYWASAASDMVSAAIAAGAAVSGKSRGFGGGNAKA